MNRFLLTPWCLDRPAPDLRTLAGPGWSINETDVPEGAVMPRLAAINAGIARFTEQVVRSGERAVCVSGDCCAAIGAIAGLQGAGLEPRLLWLDAHGDFNTPETTITGFIGGMPLAMLTGRGDSTVLECLGMRRLDDRRVTLCDARDLDPLEREALAASHVTHLGSLEALAHVDFGREPLHVHFDPDIIDGSGVPAMSHPTPGGLGVDEVSRVLGQLSRAADIVSVTVTAWAVHGDPAGTTRVAVWRALDALIASPPSAARRPPP